MLIKDTNGVLNVRCWGHTDGEISCEIGDMRDMLGIF